MLADSRYDVILGMPSLEIGDESTEERPYQRAVRARIPVKGGLCETNRVLISPIGVKKFRTGIRKNRCMEVFQVRTITKKCKEMQVLKDSEQNQVSEEEAFEKLLSEHKEDIAVVKILNDNKQVL